MTESINAIIKTFLTICLSCAIWWPIWD